MEEETRTASMYWVKNAVLFVVHVAMWTLWTLMIRGSKPVDQEQYDYDIVTVVLMTETTKFLLSIVFHFSTIEVSSWPSEVGNIVRQSGMGVYFAVPAFIYTLYNSLFFFNLIHFDPVSYRVLINMRIIWSGVLFQVFFAKSLGWKRWIALFLLMVGCAVNQLTPDFELTTNMYYLGTIVFQSLTSSFGGVYSEVLLKKDIDISINIKNMYLYFFSIVFNSAFIAAMRPSTLAPSQFFVGYTSLTWCIVVVGALCGFTTALFLRHLNILLKEYAHSGEMFLTAVLSAMFFGQEIDVRLVVSMLLVCLSVVIYNRSPPPPKDEQEGESSEQETGVEIEMQEMEQGQSSVPAPELSSASDEANAIEVAVK